jgi:flagellar protein FliO/FliZ
MDLLNILKALFALSIVLGLILGLAYVLRRYAPQLMARLQAQRGERRLKVIETLVLDPARRLVLVRLDDEERLILLGEGRELIEPRHKPAPKPAPAPAAKPAVKPASPPVSQDDDLF